MIKGYDKEIYAVAFSYLYGTGLKSGSCYEHDFVGSVIVRLENEGFQITH